VETALAALRGGGPPRKALEDLGDPDRAGGDAAEAENRCDQRDDEEDDGVMQHGGLLGLAGEHFTRQHCEEKSRRASDKPSVVRRAAGGEQRSGRRGVGRCGARL
jgi:hypothetical protein